MKKRKRIENERAEIKTKNREWELNIRHLSLSFCMRAISIYIYMKIFVSFFLSCLLSVYRIGFYSFKQ